MLWRAMKAPLEKIGSCGAVIAAAACPICFPKLALLGAVLGLGGLGAYEGQLIMVAQALVALAMLGHILSFRRHRRRWQLALAVLGGAAVFLGLYLLGEWLAYAGFVALVLASFVDVALFARRRFSTS